MPSQIGSGCVLLLSTLGGRSFPLSRPVLICQKRKGLTLPLNLDPQVAVLRVSYNLAGGPLGPAEYWISEFIQDISHSP